MSSTHSLREVALYYATHDGQSRRIAQRISRRLAERNILAEPRDIGLAPPNTAELAGPAVVVLIAAVRYGKHLPAADRFLELYKLVQSPPLAFASVNLTARKPDKTTATGNAYLRKSIAKYQ